NSEHSATLLPDATKISPPADNGAKLAARAEQRMEPAQVPALMPPPKNSDRPEGAETSATNPSSPVVETSVANPSSATLNLDLARVPDAKRVQQRLIELGYLSGLSDGAWGPKSRRALSEFRTAEKLGQDDHWDQ